MSNCENRLELPYNAIIPYSVQSDENLSESAKLYFGQITGLAIKYGYIWATDEQLAELKKTSIRNIQRWNQQLEECGHIYRETQNVPSKKQDGSYIWIKKRKIFVDQKTIWEKRNSKKDCGTATNGESLEPATNGESLEPATNGGRLSKSSICESLKQQPKSAPSAVVVPSLGKLELEETLKNRICNEYSKEEIDKAVERCIRWKSRPSDQIGIMTTLSRADSWIDNDTPDEILDKNMKYLESLKHLEGKKISNMTVVIGNKYIEFNNLMYCNTFSAEDKEFKKQVIEFLENLYSKEDISQEFEQFCP